MDYPWLFIRPQGGWEAGWLPNFRRLVLGCMDSYDSEKRRILQGLSRSTRFAFLFTALNSNLQSFAPLIFAIFSLKFWDLSGAKHCKSGRSRKSLQNEPLVAIVAVHTAENEPLKVLRVICSLFQAYPYPAPGDPAGDRAHSAAIAQREVRSGLKKMNEITLKLLRGSFSAVWTATIATKSSFWAFEIKIFNRQLAGKDTLEVMNKSPSKL